MEQFTQTVISVIKNIPFGKIMTYGQVARVSGSSRGARQVVRILHTMSEKFDLPWYRVINSKGQIGERDSEMMAMQKDLLLSEGVTFLDAKTIDLDCCLFEPN